MLLSFFDEMRKIAGFSEFSANKVLSLAKKLQLPKASGRVVSNLQAAPTYKRLINDAKSVGRQIGYGMDYAAEEGIKGSAAHPFAAKLRKRIIFPGSGNLEKQIRNIVPTAPNISAKNKKMLNAVLKGHELDETLVKGVSGAAHFGHRSPDVIFREHNRLVSLPKKYDDIKNFMLHIREARGETSLFPKGMVYGSGQRLSRHARKRLTESIHNKSIEEAKHIFSSIGKEFDLEKSLKSLGDI